VTDEVYGKIVQLSSKDVDSDSNTIRMESQVKKVKSTITMKLSPDDYQLACDAHKNNKTIKLKAEMEKNKTQYRVTDLQEFKVL
jgi:hypothetical protein